jgi:putative DNA primase/helicase
LIPFTVTIPAEERDGDLAEKLRQESPGILQWLLDGCRDWQEHGLGPPKIVTDATTAYLEGEDSLIAWMDERCQLEPKAWTKSGELYADWKSWTDQAGEHEISQRRFSQRLESRGFVPERKNVLGRGFRGLRLRFRMAGDGQA